MSDAVAIIWGDLAQYDELTPAFENFLKWIGDDEIVKWYFHCYFANDVAELKKALGKENAQIVLDYYDCHCR